MNARRTVFALVLVLAGVALLAGPVTGSDAGDVTNRSATESPDGWASVQDESPVEACADDPPSAFTDPDGGNADVVGWVDGYWYNEPLDIDIEGGLTRPELVQLSARTAARFEAMRCLTAEEGVPPVDIITREEYQDALNQSGGASTEPSDARLFEDAKLETLLLVTDQEDAGNVSEEQRGQTTAGFYDFVSDEITIITEDRQSLLLDEQVLAHEIGHAIQDQHFPIGEYERPTVDRDNGILGLIEGDVHLIEQRYLEACENGYWETECITQNSADNETDGGNETDGESGADEEESQPDIPSWGLHFMNFQPYSDGPDLVRQTVEEGGWEAVNDLYGNPPQSAKEVANPELFGEFEPVEIEVTDRSNEEWERLSRGTLATTDEQLAYDTIGISGITGMFADPAIESEGLVYPLGNGIYNTNATGGIDTQNPYNYVHPETEGWTGDRLYAYQSGDETATVWRLAWETTTDAALFVDAYETVLEYHNGTAVEGERRTYSFAPDSEFDGAVTIDHDGDRVTIVTAPSVEELGAVHEGVLANAGADGGDGADGGNDGSDGSDGGDADGTDGSDGGDGSEGGDGSDGETEQNDTDGDGSSDADDDGPGFGIGVALVALGGAGYLAKRKAA